MSDLIAALKLDMYSKKEKVFLFIRLALLVPLILTIYYEYGATLVFPFLVLGIVLEAFAYLLKLILVMGAENANLTKKAWERIEYLSRYSHYHEMSKPKGDSNAKTNKELH